MTDLPDINVWVALAVEDHPHHARATTYWRTESSPRVAFNSATMMGFLRVLANPHTVGAQPLTVAEAWVAYREYRRQARVTYEAEPRRCQIELDKLLTANSIRPKSLSDAYLAAFAGSGGFRLISFDSDFASFSGLNWLYLGDKF